MRFAASCFIFGGLCQLPKIYYDYDNSMFACFLAGVAIGALVMLLMDWPFERVT